MEEKMKESLLSHIVSDFVTEYENAANSSIAYLLNNYEPAREALKNILDVNEVPGFYKTELATKEHGRPDITGFDSDGEKVVLIEGKFWANLTDNQPENYLKELSKNGELLFLTPEKRINSLELELKRRMNGEIDTRLSVISWIEFLSKIEQKNKGSSYIDQLASDLTQLKELCNKMDEEGMPPLSVSDLDPMHGKLVYNFTSIIDECKCLT